MDVPKRKSMSFTSIFLPSKPRSSPILTTPSIVEENVSTAPVEAVQIYPKPDSNVAPEIYTRRRHHSVSTPIVLAQHETGGRLSHVSTQSGRSTQSSRASGDTDSPRRIQLVPKTMRNDSSPEIRTQRAVSMPNIDNLVIDAQCEVEEQQHVIPVVTPIFSPGRKSSKQQHAKNLYVVHEEREERRLSDFY